MITMLTSGVYYESKSTRIDKLHGSSAAAEALVLIPNINELQIAAPEHTHTGSICATVIKPKSSGIQLVAFGTWLGWWLQMSTRKQQN